MGMGAELLEDIMLNELIMEGYLQDLCNKRCWQTAGKRVIPFKEMTTDHLKNTIKWLERHPFYPSQELFMERMNKEIMNRRYSMTKEEFKLRWESNDQGGGITFEDIAECAQQWGLFSHPKVSPIGLVRYRVLKAAGTIDAEDFNPAKEEDDDAE